MTSNPTDLRPYDIVVYGATGFVGELVAADLADHAPQGLRLALAGRSSEKLHAVRERLPERARTWDLLTADSSDATSLDELARSSRVVITTVGPYARYGLPLVQACAAAGTHYVDLTGEVLFARDCIDTADAAARRSGARIINSCGYDSVPSDLAVLLAATTAREADDGELTETTCYASMKGGMSGGTVASAMQQADDIAEHPARRKVAGDKFSLSPRREAEPRGEFADSLKVWFSTELGAWTAPFLMSSYNTRIVRRSNALTGHSYGTGFRYREVMKTGAGLRGRAMAYAVAGALAGGFAMLSFRRVRPLVERLVPAPGTGPSEASRDAGFFRMDVRTTTTSGARYRSIVAAPGDPGYKATAVMLGEAALALALEEVAPLPHAVDVTATAGHDVPHDDASPACGPTRGGVLTPAVGLGLPYAERLRARGFTLTAERTN